MNNGACTVLYDVFDPGLSAWRLPITLCLIAVALGLLYVFSRRRPLSRPIQVATFLCFILALALASSFVAEMLYIPSHSVTITAYVGPPTEMVEGEIQDFRQQGETMTFRVGDHAFAAHRDAKFRDPDSLATARRVRIIYMPSSQTNGIVRVERCDPL